jgi:hypothetical protein
MSAELLRFPVKEIEMTRQMSYDDDFEMLTLRHEYLKKIKDPESINIKPFKYLAKSTARIMYEKCQANFQKVGFDVSDIESISNVYLFAYLGVYSFEVNPASKDRFIQSFLDKTGKEPNEKDIEKAEKNTIINFLRQKLHHCSKVCERKSRNIVGARSVKYVFAYTKDSKPSHPSNIVQDYKKHGYRKVTHKELVEAKENSKKNSTQDLTDKDGFKIVEIQDYSMNMCSFKDMEAEDGYGLGWEEFVQKEPMVGYYMEECAEYLSDPEENLIKRQDEILSMSDKDFFSNLEEKQKRSMLRKFIASNKDNTRLSEELKTARSFLKK